MQTTLHTFKFDIREPADKLAWCELKAKLKNGPPCHGPVFSDVYSQFTAYDGTVVDLQTEHLFNNQWNMEQGNLRVFDFALESLPYNRNLRRGHYLEQTEEMREVRRNTIRCPYCGKTEPAAAGSVFCSKCLGSPYLKLEDLLAGATRMRPIDSESGWTALQPGERNHLLPLYKAARTAATNTQIAEFLKKTKERARKKIGRAYCERRGYERLIELGLGMIAMQNVIYYEHTGRFGFGWREPLSAIELSTVLDVISEFSFPYDIKTADGRTLSGN
jgi:hypothetical protein